MQFLEKIKLIQGGMGIYISNWRLARAVAMERPGETVGTVSGTALDVAYARLLQLGDPGGHIQRAFNAFDNKFKTDIAQQIYQTYFIDGGKSPDEPFKRTPMPLVHSQDGKSRFPMPTNDASLVDLEMDEKYVELLIVSGFAEVWLAKEGHEGLIFINLLKKIELPLIHVMYGAMLAGVNGIIIGAGNPDGLPAICSLLANHETVAYSPSVLYRAPGEEFTIPFYPKRIANGNLTKEPLQRPAFLAIAAQETLVKALAESTSEAPDGLIIEHHSAGGHNANPLGPMIKDPVGQPLYGEKDEADLVAIKEVGLPFWLAGGYGNKEKLKEALDSGANGIQVGSVFALTEESGMKSEYRLAILNKIKEGTESSLVRTTMFSSTGFAFKVAQIDGTLSEEQVYKDRHRLCDLGFLQQVGFSKPNEDGVRTLFHRCPAAPIGGFVGKRGLERNTEERRCLCNGLFSAAGLGQIVKDSEGNAVEEPAIVTLGDDIEGIRQSSRHGQTQYWVRDVVKDILG